MDDKKRLDMDKFKEIVSSKQIKMASENSLFEKMMLPPGVVSPFGLLNNEDEDRMCFHPNTNEKTLFLKTVDLLKYLESIEYKANIIEI